jgi:riboflavin synthase
MFTGIIETLGTITDIKPIGNNIQFKVQSGLADTLKIDQSLAHDGVCLTIVDIQNDIHTVDAIQETLDKTNLGLWKTGQIINLERAMQSGSRLDGHMVQGHVDSTAVCIDRKDLDQSWLFTFQLSAPHEGLLVDKGSICVNGISLTVVNPTEMTFSVAIIPYTFEHTNLHQVGIGDKVNIEFDILGKYILNGMKPYINALMQKQE